MNKYFKGLVIGGMVAAMAFAAGCGDDKKPADPKKPAAPAAPAATSAAFTQKNKDIKVPANVADAFKKAIATDNVKDGKNWMLMTTKSQDQITAELNQKGYFVYVFNGEGPDHKKKYKAPNGGDAWENHARTVTVKVCPHMVVNCKTEAYNAGPNKPGKKVYGDVIKEKDVKYAQKTKNGKRNCVHDGKDVAFDAKL